MTDVVMIVSDGYSLKKYRVKKWIYDNNHTQPYVAKAIGLSPDEFKRKLREHDKFTREQITSLVYLMGAREMFFAIYFPTNKERKRVFRETFGYELYAKRRKRRQRIIWVK